MTILGYSHAYAGKQRIDSTQYDRLFHGTDSYDPDEVKRLNGFPPRGTDLDLVNHVGQVGGGTNSAFRGSTQLFCSPHGDAGAALWGDWVYEVVQYRGYHLNSVLEGRVPLPCGQFGNNPWPGEQEVAIPAEVPIAYIEKVARVIVGVRGRRPEYLKSWWES